ncbi:SulP family inorganic anion transporter [Erythrobacter sp. SD-21]|uniref:SulP family inorganic anion transporter n=1 Tax=Erythrobacter sp. SD-21 TaxID=161528 RepID=UPI000153FC2E|nr:SulP family inorganic anion transporter [Erythrobacter sp. SD-21]EDL49163.1 sulfate permease [Erythrobacter sp. SD-21]
MAGEALVPTIKWLAASTPRSLLRDVIAGLVLSILLVPQAMAYAQLAGLPPQMGLFAALTPPLLYLVFGTSPFVSLGPVALVSLVIGEVVGSTSLAPEIGAEIIAIEAGLLLLLLGGFGLGRLVNFISEPVLLGFTAAAAVLIAASQLPTLLGINAARAGDLPTALGGLWVRFGSIKPVTAAIGLAALVTLVLAGRYAAPLLWKMGVKPPFRLALAKSFPLVVIVVAGLVASSSAAPVPMVEAVEGGLPEPVFPFVPLEYWLQLLPGSFAVAIIIFVTATAVAKALAGEDRSNLDTSREAVALGAGNVVAAVTGGYAVGASLSRSALVRDSGGHSPLVTVCASAVVVAVLFFLAPLLAYLPQTALAALVISAVFGLVKTRDIRMVWQHDRVEGLIIGAAFVATLLFGVQLGLAIGAVLGLAHFLWFSSTPRVTQIGTADGGTTYRSVRRDDVTIKTLPVLVVRIDRTIYFGNSEYCEDRIVKLVAQYEGVEHLVLDMRAVNAVDASGAAMLLRLVQRMRDYGVIVHFAATHEPVAQKIRPYGGERSDFHRTVSDALEACGVPEEGPIPYT